MHVLVPVPVPVPVPVCACVCVWAYVCYVRACHLRLVRTPRRVPWPTVGHVKHSYFGLHSRNVTEK
jgi:hypothetical protein